MMVIMVNQPMDPKELGDGETEFGWGAGQFPPGIAANEGQTKHQESFADPYPDILPASGDESDNYARAVADRRTDPTDPTSERDFEACGLEDRYGASPPLVREAPQPNKSERPELQDEKPARRW